MIILSGSLHSIMPLTKAICKWNSQHHKRYSVSLNSFKQIPSYSNYPLEEEKTPSIQTNTCLQFGPQSCRHLHQSTSLWILYSFISSLPIYWTPLEEGCTCLGTPAKLLHEEKFLHKGASQIRHILHLFAFCLHLIAKVLITVRGW